MKKHEITRSIERLLNTCFSNHYTIISYNTLGEIILYSKIIPYDNINIKINKLFFNIYLLSSKCDKNKKYILFFNYKDKYKIIFES